MDDYYEPSEDQYYIDPDGNTQWGQPPPAPETMDTMPRSEQTLTASQGMLTQAAGMTGYGQPQSGYRYQQMGTRPAYDSRQFYSQLVDFTGRSLSNPSNIHQEPLETVNPSFNAPDADQRLTNYVNGEGFHVKYDPRARLSRSIPGSGSLG